MLVELDMLADRGCLADNDAGPMVNEEAPADRGAGMYVYSRHSVGIFGHDPGNERYLSYIKLVGYTVYAYRSEGRVGDDDFIRALGSRVSFVGSLHIGKKDLLYLGKS